MKKMVARMKKAIVFITCIIGNELEFVPISQGEKAGLGESWDHAVEQES